MRRRRGLAPIGRLTDENGAPVTFTTPGDPTPEERRRYALAVQRATTPAPLTKSQEKERRAALARELELFPDRYRQDWDRDLPRPRRRSRGRHAAD